MNSQIIKYIKNVVVLAFFVITIPIVAVILIKPDAENNLNEWKVKRLRFESLSSPRILFVGDSNLAFGLDSRAVANSFHCNVQNAGLHAGIGLYYCLQEYDDLIRKDDVIVICCTYQQYVRGYGESITLPVAVYYNDWNGLHKFNFSQWKVFLSGFMEIIRQHGLNLEDERTYRASYYNIYGDESKHWEFQPLDSIPEMGFPNMPLNDNMIEYLFDKIEHWEECGAVVYFFPACITEKFFEKFKNQFMSIEKKLYEMHHPFVVPIDSCVYDDSFFYDGNYHLNKKGVDRFTNLIVNHLKKKRAYYE